MFVAGFAFTPRLVFSLWFLGEGQTCLALTRWWTTSCVTTKSP